MYIAQIKLTNYDELGCVLNNMLKLCIIAIDHNANIINKNKNSAIDVSLILEILLQLFPVDEFELLTEINQKLIIDIKSCL
ncbi:hypothetical protein SAMN05443663_106268 [Flavobacterium defluvii]|uniref:Uncharacterized protein n=1 Tax=Flavobacterium defluvii TaxID=370979 RepID=A0A1M5RPB3_9FLAO|nr:hypothetical protein SAMN05443663_106268 [Flavobacterium defluvii]